MKSNYFQRKFFVRESAYDDQRDVDASQLSHRANDRDLSSLSVAEVKAMFQAGDLDYDTLLKFLLSDQGDSEIDDMVSSDEDDFDGADDSFDDQRGEKIQESAPPGEEDWVQKMKPKFLKKYGKKKGTETLYATAWKRHQAVKEAWGDDDFDDDDGLSSAERELIARSDKALKKRGVKVDDFDPDEVKKPAPRSQTSARKDVDRSEDDNGKDEKVDKKPQNKSDSPTRSRGKPIGERGGNIRSWFKENPNASRKDFMTKAADMGMGAKHANTLYYTLKRKVSECFFIGMDGKYLTEASSLISPKFIDLTESGELLVFEKKHDAYRMVDILRASGKTAFVL